MDAMNEKKRGLAKVLGGLILMIAGTMGFFFGKNAKKKTLKLSIFAISAISLAAGLYLFVDGTTDLAVGVSGQLQLPADDSSTQTMTFPGPQFFKMSLVHALAHDPALKTLRRLRYQCADGSESFTVFVTRWGVLGVPGKSVTCADGSKLVDYDPSKNFVMEVRE